MVNENLLTFDPEGPAMPGGPVKPRIPLWPWSPLQVTQTQLLLCRLYAKSVIREWRNLHLFALGANSRCAVWTPHTCSSWLTLWTHIRSLNASRLADFLFRHHVCRDESPCTFCPGAPSSPGRPGKPDVPVAPGSPWGWIKRSLSVHSALNAADMDFAAGLWLTLAPGSPAPLSPGVPSSPGSPWSPCERQHTRQWNPTGR